MRMSWGLALGLIGFTLLGCTGGASSAPEANGPTSTTASPPKPMEGELKVALITPGPVSDSGWNAMAYAGLKAIETDLGAKVSNQEAAGPKISDAMRSYAQDGYQLVFGHGFEYNEPAVEVGKAFPNTIFITSSGGGTSTNVGAFRFYLEQGFYLAGYMAGKMSKTGKVAMIGGDDVPSIRSTFKGFVAGAKAARADIVVIEKFTGSGSDVAAAKQATTAAINEGADFVIHQANAAAQGVFEACKEKKVYAFGANLNQNSNESGIVIASATINAEPAFLKIAKSVKDGTFKGEVVLVGMSDGAIDFVLNPAMRSVIPETLVREIEAERTKILEGQLTVPKDEF
ncbi:MAG: BMP family protein [Fimbriimonadaceae bacterium]|nr:BMP family protein [Fimbriimonadaceae bacterium]